MANLNAGDLLNSILSAAGNQGGGANFGDLSELVKVIRNTKLPDAEQLASLKTGLESLVNGENLPAAVRLKLAPLMAALQSVQGNAPENNQQAWDFVKPFLSDKEKLASMASMFGEYGGKLLDILKAVFLRA